MKDYLLRDTLPDYTISRQDILKLAQKNNPLFRELKGLLSYMIENSKLEHIGRNQYRKVLDSVNTTKYENKYSDISLQIISIMEEEFPLIEYRIWEFRWLNIIIII